MTAHAYRRSTAADAERLARGVVDGIAAYRTFAPSGWTAPSLEDEVERLRGLLGDPDVWSLLAETGGELAGHVTFLPAAKGGRPVDDPALAHFRNLFVRPAEWGTGLARELHSAAVAAAAERGFAAMRLFAAAGQLRARRFYEREGWEPAGDEHFDPVVGLPIVEYRLALRERDPA